MSFARRRLEAVISLGSGTFGETQGDTVKLSGLRMSVRVSSLGGDAMGQVQMRVYGLTLAMMNRLTTVGPGIATQIRGKNRLIISAGDEDGARAIVFNGTIDTAYADFSGSPDTVFLITGFAGLAELLRPVPVSTFQGSASVADIMKKLADQMNLTFENSGVDLRLSNPYFPGTALTQVRACARAAGINYVVDRGVLAIWPRRGARAGDVPVMSAETGMVGYPTYTGSGISVSSIFVPNVKQGGKIKMESILAPANGEWVVTMVQHDLSAETPGGPWFTYLDCVKVAPV